MPLANFWNERLFQSWSIKQDKNVHGRFKQCLGRPESKNIGVWNKTLNAWGLFSYQTECDTICISYSVTSDITVLESLPSDKKRFDNRLSFLGDQQAKESI